MIFSDVVVRLNRCLWAIALSILAVCVTQQETFAVEQTVSLEVKAGYVPRAAMGLLLSSLGTVQKPDTTIETVGEGVLRVSFTIDESEVQNDTVATALVTLDNDEMVFAPMHAIWRPAPDLPPIVPAPLPQCAPEKIAEIQLAGQEGLFLSLVEVRAKRRELARMQLENIMNAETLAKFQKLENGFGLNQAKELSPDLAPMELIERLWLLKQAITNFEYHKEKRALKAR